MLRSLSTMTAISTGVILRPIYAVRKSYSYRYEVSDVAGPESLGLKRNAKIIETRYRGRTASWTIRTVTGSGDVWEVRGTFVEPPGFELGGGATLAVEPPVSVAEAAPALETVAAVAIDELPFFQPFESETPALDEAPRPARTTIVDDTNESPRRSQSPSAVALREFYASMRRRSGAFDPVVS